jgi:hypothetical protein
MVNSLISDSLVLLQAVALEIFIRSDSITIHSLRMLHPPLQASREVLTEDITAFTSTDQHQQLQACSSILDALEPLLMEKKASRSTCRIIRIQALQSLYRGFFNESINVLINFGNIF